METGESTNGLTIKRRAQARIPTAEGEFRLCLYTNHQDAKEHLALVIGDIDKQQSVLVRMHSECFTGDVLGSHRCDCGGQLKQAMKLLAQEGAGVLVYLRQEGRGIGLLKKLRAYNLQDEGHDTVDANLLLGHGADERDYTIAALILRDLGVSCVRLLTNNPDKMESLQALGIPVIARVPLAPRITSENARYLLTKVQRMRHLLNLDASDGAGADSSGEQDLPTVPAASPAVRVQLHRTDEPQPPTSLNGSGEPLRSEDEGIHNILERIAGHRQRMKRPFITLTYAQSIDGCIAARAGQPLTLSGKQSLVLTHRLRAAHQAILAGIGTVLADNPSLTVRLVEGRDPQPIVPDSRLRFPLDANLLSHPSRSPWIATSEHADVGRQRTLEAAEARVLRLPANVRGQVDLAALMKRLGELGIDSVMVEGGARIITSFLSERLVDHLVLTVAPTLVGGLRAVRRLGPSAPACFPRLRNVRYERLEEDLIVWGDPDWEA